MKYGFFSEDNKEYIITTPHTPLPWINYIGNNNLQGIITNTGGGYTFYKDARLMRLTRYRYNNIPMDFGGRYFYFKIGNDFFSPGFKPVMAELDSFECHHGFGYTKIISEKHKIKSSVTYFVPPTDNVEIWDLKVKNLSSKKILLTIYPFVEFCLWNAWDDFTNFQRNYSTGEVFIKNSVIYHITEYRERRNHFAYFTSSEKPISFETQRDTFIGKGDLNIPQGIKQDKLNNSIAHGWAPCAVFQNKIELNPGEEKRIIYQLGYFENPKSQKFKNNKLNTELVEKLIAKYKKHSNVDKAFEILTKEWNELLDKFQVKTNNIYMNRMFLWNQYQNVITYKMSRSASLFESGIGRGMGFRDSNQDLLGFMHINTEKAKERIFDLASTQLKNGHVYHQYQPLTKRGNNDSGTNYNDDPLWLVISTAAYLRETRNFNFLNKKVPFENDESQKESLYFHLYKALNFIVTHKGPHKLPLIGRADWNDCLNLNSINTIPGVLFSDAPLRDGKIAESTLIGMLFVFAAKEFKKITEILKDSKMGKWINKEIKSMEEALAKYAWDGDWWLRAYDAKSKKIGSKICKEGKLYIEPQGWAVMANIGGKVQQRKALESIDKYLATEHGIMLVQPAYSKYYVNIGEITSYPPGYKENGSIFCHTNSWIIISNIILGNNKKAFDYYMRICPAKREEISENHKCEPYVYAQMIAGKDAATFGEAKNSWLTGTASWSFVALSQYILGIHPKFDGLYIKPAVPTDFGNYTITRLFRNTVYNIEINFESDLKAPYFIEKNRKFSGNFIKHNSKFKKRHIRIFFSK